MRRGSLVQCFLLAAVLAAGCSHSGVAAKALKLYPPFALSVTNMTTNFTANQPVSWTLVTKSGNADKAMDSGYSVDDETPTMISMTSGYTTGVFVLTGTVQDCTEKPCSQSVKWIVFSDVAASLLGLVVASTCTLVLMFCLSQMKPMDPMDKMPGFGNTKGPSYGSTALKDPKESKDGHKL